MHRFSVLIADDNDLLRKCFASFIRESGDIDVIGEASDGSAAVEMAKRLLPDAVIMDVNMPYMDGIAASRAIHAEFPQILVIGLSMFDKSDMGEKMLEAGAVAYFSKTDPFDKIIEGIHDVLAPQASTELPA